MSFVGIEFSEKEGGGIALILGSWLTPRKKQVFWPPYKSQEDYKKALKNQQSCDPETWQLYDIRRIFFEDGNYFLPPKRLFESDDSEEESARGLLRPPIIKLKSIINREGSSVAAICGPATPLSANPSLSSIIVTPSSSSLQPSTPHRNKEDVNNYLPNSYLLDIIREQNKEIAVIKEQTKEILSLVRKQGASLGICSVTGIPEDIPVQLPINCMENLNILDEYLMNKTKSNAVKFFVIAAVRLKHPELSEDIVENYMKEWLKHSPQKAKLRFWKMVFME
ncbi:reverse transcriptase (rna-dependent dna polymerase) [Holotrichia oblita]|uniref:Reverse transcriptase (Rna-dependent dna polymerase) n=1 Tax=Holotrichia oblita TaxID=644536 RepID=A0ACB9TE59_HOLOL|nr:reverse transcriptase (rna-dependent dna polymerase) [Holotrichia oblita]